MQKKPTMSSKPARAAKLLAALMVFVITQQSGATAPNSTAASKNSAGATNIPGIRKVAGPLGGIEEYLLEKNGLTVLLYEQHLAPVVSVMMVYKIGSRNEAVGYTGATHFLEHMMFKGTRLHDPLKGTGVDDVLKPIGGINNGTTSQDRTTYWEVAPAKNIDLLLELEADRMRGLLLRDSDRKQEMTVVRNELERDEDSASDLLMTNLFAMSFREHPYHHPIIGWRSDVENVPTARLKKFYDDFYWPENAVLIVSGDFDKGNTLARIARRFSDIGRAPAKMPPVYTKEPRQEGERRFIVRRGQDIPRMIVGYHTPEAAHKDIYALEVMQSILGDDDKPSGRLYKALIETELATDVYALNHVMRDPGLFIAGATPSGDTSLEKVEQVLKEEIAALAKTPPTADEVNRAIKEITRQYRLDGVDQLSKAQQLADAIAVSDWKWWIDYPGKIREVTPQDIKNVAERYIKNSNATVGHYKPASSEKSSAAADQAAGAGTSQVPDQAGNDRTSQVQDQAAGAGKTEGSTPEVSASARTPRATPVGKGKIASRVERIKFNNGLTALVLPIEGSGVVSVSGRVLAGKYFTGEDRSKVPVLMADLLTAGTQKYSKLEISESLEEMGASLSFASDTYFLTFGSDVVREDLSKLMRILSQCLRHPLFKADELEKARTILVSNLKERSVDTGSTAQNALVRALYKPGSAYSSSSYDQQIKDAQAVTVDAIKEFQQKQVTAANSVMVFAGDVDRKTIISLLEREFGDWARGPRSSIDVSRQEIIERKGQIEIVTRLKDKSNVEVITGKPVAVSIKSKDYFATTIANAALGYDPFASRLAPIRDRMGLSYSINSFIDDPSFEYSPWCIRYSVNPENLTRAKKAVADIVSRYVKEGISPDELTKEKGHLSGVYVVSNRTPRAIASRLASYETLGLPIGFIDEYGDKLRAVTLTQVNAAIRSYLGLEGTVTSISGTVAVP